MAFFCLCFSFYSVDSSGSVDPTSCASVSPLASSMSLSPPSTFFSVFSDGDFNGRLVGDFFGVATTSQRIDILGSSPFRGQRPCECGGNVAVEQVGKMQFVVLHLSRGQLLLLRHRSPHPAVLNSELAIKTLDALSYGAHNVQRITRRRAAIASSREPIPHCWGAANLSSAAT